MKIEIRDPSWQSQFEEWDGTHEIIFTTYEDSHTRQAIVVRASDEDLRNLINEARERLIEKSVVS